MADAPFYLQEPVDPITKLGLANYLQMQAAAVPPDQAQINNAVMNQPEPQRAPAQAADPRALKALQKYLPPKPMAAPASNDQIAAYTGLSEKSLADQQATLSGLNQYIDSIASKPQGLNLTPLAGYIDSFTGSKLSPAAQALAPQSADDRDKMLFGLRNQLATGQEKLSNDRLQATQYAQTMQRQMAHDAEQARHNAATEQIGLTRGDGMNIRGQVALGNQAIGVGKDIEHDPIIKQSKASMNALTRSTSILDNPNKPVTSKDLSLAYDDFTQSVAQGGAAAQAKIQRELPETYAQMYNELQQKLGTNEDMRKSPAGAALIKMLKENIRTVRGDLNGAIRDQYNLIKGNYAGVDNNPKVQVTLAAKDKLYTDYLNSDENRRFAGGNSSSSPQATPTHGATVQQGGKTFKWNGSKYVEQK